MDKKLINNLKSHSVIKRYSENPILTAKDVPYKSALVFNAGVTKYQGRYVMVFRNDYGSVEERRLDGTNLGLAFSDNGINWEVESKPFLEISDSEIICVNDPRLTVIDGCCFITIAVITTHGVRGGIAVTEDFEDIELLSVSVPDNRNFTLFTKKIGGKYLRLERPFSYYSRAGEEQFDIWISKSPDLKYWGNFKLLLRAEEVQFCNSKIGPGTPPLETDRGWLTLFHAVDIDTRRGKNGWEDRWQKRYTVGMMLLDPEDPSKITGICREPVMIPETEYEISGGFRNNVIFPCAMLLEDSGEVKIYYGAADTVECLATADVNEMLDLCKSY